MIYLKNFWKKSWTFLKVALSRKTIARKRVRPATVQKLQKRQPLNHGLKLVKKFSQSTLKNATRAASQNFSIVGKVAKPCLVAFSVTLRTKNVLKAALAGIWDTIRKLFNWKKVVEKKSKILSFRKWNWIKTNDNRTVSYNPGDLRAEICKPNKKMQTLLRESISKLLEELWWVQMQICMRWCMFKKLKIWDYNND